MYLDQSPFFRSYPDSDGLLLIAGPCVAESEEICLRIADRLSSVTESDLTVVFKASYDKANRTSRKAFRGPGIEEGLRILEKVREKTGLPLLTDIHSPREAKEASEVVDILQIPAFLCRQTDLLIAAGETGKYVNIKKGQFMAPEDMRYALAKTGGRCLLTERGTFFGYNRLVVDFPGILTMKKLGAPVVFDATHSVQTPGGGQGCSAGNRELAVPLARAAVSVGAHGLFFEIHPDPDNALCDGPNSVQLDRFISEIPRFVELHQLINRWNS
ncbi:MAG: 3-deoxy-8-phosphooctulonate synthase [Chitinivibrionales bacterium]